MAVSNIKTALIQWYNGASDHGHNGF